MKTIFYVYNENDELEFIETDEEFVIRWCENHEEYYFFYDEE